MIRSRVGEGPLRLLKRNTVLHLVLAFIPLKPGAHTHMVTPYVIIAIPIIWHSILHFGVPVGGHNEAKLPI